VKAGTEAEDLACAAVEYAREEVEAASDGPQERDPQDLPATGVALIDDKKTLKTARRIHVPVLEADKAIIEAKARALGLSAASYLRQLGLGLEPPSTLDSHAVRELAKINGDQGRLGGLLKLWLTDDAKFSDFAHPRGVRSDVLTLLQQLGESQKKLQALMQRLVEGSAHK
jgi:hypothetical protein